MEFIKSRQKDSGFSLSSGEKYELMERIDRQKARPHGINDLPYEIMGAILSLLSPGSLFECSLLNHKWEIVATEQMWRFPKCNPLITKIAWRTFLKTLIASFCSPKLSKFPYYEYVERIDDLWLNVGGEDNLLAEDIEFMTKFSRTPSSYGSCGSVLIFDCNPGSLSTYSLHHALYHMVEVCPRLTTLSINLLTELFLTSLKKLKSLELGIRVTDSKLRSILPGSFGETVYALTKLDIRWGEISDKGMIQIADSCPLLQSVCLCVVELKGSRAVQGYHVTDFGLSRLLTQCCLLEVIHIYKLRKVSIEAYHVLSTQNGNVKSLTFTLNHNFGITAQNILELLRKMTVLENVTLYGGLVEAYPTDGVVSECDVRELAKQNPSIKKIRLVNMDFVQTNLGYNQYFATKSMPHEVIEFSRSLMADTGTVVEFITET